MKVAGKVVVITGAGNGMAREVTLECIRRGAKVAAVDINQEALDETVRLAGSPATGLSTHIVNIADLTQVSALPEAVIAAHGQVDGIMNIAGIIHQFKRVNDLSYDDVHRVFNVNFFGTVHMCKEFLPHLLARSEAQILNISSMGGYVPVPGQTIYGASKAAVKLFTEGLRAECAGTNVGVALLFPGAIATNMPVNSGLMSQAEADAMAKQGGKQYKTTPADATMMDRLSRLVPERAAKLIQKQMQALLR